MAETSVKITHTDLCIATAKRFINWVALYEYQSFASFTEQPDVLILNEGSSVLFEIKISFTDFMADQHKACRKKYRCQYWLSRSSYLVDIEENGIPIMPPYRYEQNKNAVGKLLFTLESGHIEAVLVEKEHLGNKRYYVCPWGIIPIDKLPEGWGLYYYRNGKFFLKKKSEEFRSNLRKENSLALHALRRYASGDSKGIMVKTYRFNPGGIKI
jgi:hypothetical protein